MTTPLELHREIEAAFQEEIDGGAPTSRLVVESLSRRVLAIVDRLAAARAEPPKERLDVERLARAMMAAGIVKWDDKVGMHASYDTVAAAIAAEYDRLRP